MSLTWTQSALLATLPKISSLLSLAGSTWIVIEILTHGGRGASAGAAAHSNSNINSKRTAHQPKRQHPYHRLLLAMSVYDILECFWNFGSTWPIPKASGKVWAIGTTATCSAQGFFLMLGVAVPIYNAMLALYYMLVIKYQYPDSYLKNRVEPAMHCIAGLWAFGTSIAAAFLGLYNDANLWCWISSHPQGCKDTLRYGAENATCERGDNAWIYQWTFYFAPLWSSILLATYCTASVFLYVRQLDKKSFKYRRPEASSRALTLTSTRSLHGLQSTTTRSTKFGKQRNAIQFDDDDDDVDPTNDTNNETNNTMHQQLQQVPITPDMVNSDGGVVITAMTVNKASGKKRTSKLELKPTAASLQAMAELDEDAKGDHFLSGSRGNDDDDDDRAPPTTTAAAVSSSSQRTLDHSLRSNVGSLADQISTWKLQRQLYKDEFPRTISVMNQSVCFLLAFYLTHVWSTSNRLYQLIHNKGPLSYGVVLAHSWFDPFQGFLNYFVYQRPRYMYIRKTKPELGAFAACLRVLEFSFMKQRKANEMYKGAVYNSYQNGPTTATSKNHNTMSYYDDDDSDDDSDDDDDVVLDTTHDIIGNNDSVHDSLQPSSIGGSKEAHDDDHSRLECSLRTSSWKSESDFSMNSVLTEHLADSCAVTSTTTTATTDTDPTVVDDDKTTRTRPASSMMMYNLSNIHVPLSASNDDNPPRPLHHTTTNSGSTSSSSHPQTEDCDDINDEQPAVNRIPTVTKRVSMTGDVMEGIQAASFN